MQNDYKDYFRMQYRSTFTAKDVSDYRAWFFAQLKFIRSILPQDLTGRILEVGSGVGGFYSLLGKSEKSHYCGIELDAEAVAFACSFFSSPAFRNVSLEELEETGGYDRIYAFEVLEHLNDPIRGIMKMKALLSEDGIFIGTSPFPFRKNVLADKTHEFVLHPDNWARLFKNCGFSSVETYPMSFVPYLWRINRILNVRIPVYIPFSGFISTSLIIARKK